MAYLLSTKKYTRERLAARGSRYCMALSIPSSSATLLEASPRGKERYILVAEAKFARYTPAPAFFSDLKQEPSVYTCIL